MLRSPRNLRPNLLLLGVIVAAVANTASVLAGRPIALTSRGRARVRVDHVPPEARRLLRQMALLLVVVGVATF